ncbi:hypothetical protein JCM31598_42470 [Desulfonatronum parangueonense]
MLTQPDKFRFQGLDFIRGISDLEFHVLQIAEQFPLLLRESLENLLMSPGMALLLCNRLRNALGIRGGGVNPRAQAESCKNGKKNKQKDHRRDRARPASMFPAAG